VQKITTFLWFDNQAEEAMNHYLSIFPDSRVIGVNRYGDAGPGPAGTVMTANFELAGHEFVALNGGPHFKFTEAISLMVNCGSQEEVDRLWSQLSAGGEESQCGWLKDKFGLSWQIVPTAMFELLHSPDAAKSGRAMQAMLAMHKIDLAAIKRAYDG